jgi:hypothetical protein
MKRIVSIVTVVISATTFTLFGCGSRHDKQPSGENSIRTGVVERVRQVTSADDRQVISDTREGISADSVNREKGGADATAVSPVPEPPLPEAYKQQITVKLDDGDIIELTQQEVFEPGDLVRVFFIAGEARVISNVASEVRRSTHDSDAIRLTDTLNLISPWIRVKDFGANPTAVPNVPAGVRYYAWNQYQGFPTVMMPVSEGICFLQGVTGKFRGGGENVWVRNNGSNWELNGTSLQQDVSARAMCVPFSAIQGADQGFSYLKGTASAWVTNRPECSWWESCNPHAGQAQALFGRDGFCYLTGMGGRFDGGGESVQVHALNPARWELFASTMAWSGYIRGEAGCIALHGHSSLRTTNIVRRYGWLQGEPFRQLPNADEAFCVLSLIQGRFAGWGETVEIYHNPDLTQWLGGSSYQAGIMGEASCLYYNQR